MRTNDVKAKIDKRLQDNKWIFCGYRDETINYMKIKFSKLTQKEFDTIRDWMGEDDRLEIVQKI